MSQSIEKLLADAGLTQKVLSDLREAGEILIPEIDEILENFYTEVRASPELTGFFVDEASMSRARNGQRKHWIQMLKADLDEAYLATTKRVGLAHARIGLPMETYLKAGSKVSAEMQSRLLSKSRQLICSGEYERFADMFQAVTRVFQLDADLVTQAFFGELEKDKKKAFGLLADGLSRMAAGDFSQPIGAPEVSGFPKEYDALREHYDASLDQLGHTIASISSVVDYLSMHAGEIARSTTDLSRRTENQAATLEETTTSLQLITSSVSSTAEGTQKADKAMNAASEGAERGGKVVLEATDAMNEIVSSSREISRKIRVIDDIAFQTNLLALNAGVEAARAGDAGRGFAVVASEVRALAVRSAEAAKEIGQLIEDSSRHVEHGVSRVGEVGKALQKIVTDVATVEALVSEISESSRTQATSLSEINMAASQLDQVTQQNAAMAEETTAASQGVHQNAERLAEIVGGFQLASEHVSQPGAGNSELRRAS